MPLLRVPVLRLLRPLPLAPQGIKADMFVRDAKARCPHLTVVPYNFDAYGEALSCDEAFLDMIECLDDNMEVVTQRMRKEIFGTTKCTASACIAENKLLPCLATRSAKPNGQLFISSEKPDDYLNTLPIKALLGIGFTVSSKLKSTKVEYRGQLRNVSNVCQCLACVVYHVVTPYIKDALHRDFGKKISNMLWNYCRRIDHSVGEDFQGEASQLFIVTEESRARDQGSWLQGECAGLFFSDVVVNPVFPSVISSIEHCCGEKKDAMEDRKGSCLVLMLLLRDHVSNNRNDNGTKGSCY